MKNYNGSTASKIIQEALVHYASFFAKIADGEPNPEKELENIKSLDRRAIESLDDNNLTYYQSKRTQLMRIFRERLVSELSGQIEKEVIRKAESLVKSFEE